MKGAWENYVTKDRTKFKPHFNFDDIATFDRALYNQINNPLILRLFLEIYNGKALPKKGTKHLHIWQDWLQKFSNDEQTFLKLLADEVWQKGENELLLDDLLKHDALNPYFTSDIINAPYNRLKNNGWISCYVKDLIGYVGFTVEGSLLYLLATQLQEHKPTIDFDKLQSILKGRNKIQRSAIESFLCEQALNEDLNLVTEAIDAGNEYIDISINPLLLYLKTFGVNTTIEKVLENSSDNDWKALEKLDGQLNELQLHILRKEFLTALMLQNEFKTKESVSLGLNAIAIFDKNDAISYLNKINTKSTFILQDAHLLLQLGHCERKFGNYDKALENYEKSLAIKFKTLGGQHHDLANLYGNIGIIWESKSEYDKAQEYFEKNLEIKLLSFDEEHPDLADSYNKIGIICYKKGQNDKAMEYFEKSLVIKLKTLGGEHPDVASSYNNIGQLWHKKGEYDKALGYFEKCLAIKLKTFGENHPDVATSYGNIGQVWNKKVELDKCLEYYEKCLAIRLITLGEDHPVVAISYNNIGSALENKGEYEKAHKYYEKCLAIQLKTLGAEHPSVAKSYFNLGDCFQKLDQCEYAIVAFQKGFKINQKGGYPFRIAVCYEELGNKIEALNYFIQCAEIRKEDPKYGLEDERTKESIQNAIRLAIEMERMEDLPAWMKNINL